MLPLPPKRFVSTMHWGDSTWRPRRRAAVGVLKETALATCGHVRLQLSPQEHCSNVCMHMGRFSVAKCQRCTVMCRRYHVRVWVHSAAGHPTSTALGHPGCALVLIGLAVVSTLVKTCARQNVFAGFMCCWSVATGLGWPYARPCNHEHTNGV